LSRCATPTVTRRGSKEAPTHRWLAKAEADHGRAIRRRRAPTHRRTTGAVAAEAVDAHGPPRQRRRAARQKTILERVARDTPLRRSLRSLRPCPATGPARNRLRACIAPTQAEIRARARFRAMRILVT